MSDQGWPRVEGTEVQQQHFELTLDEFARQMEAAARSVKCSDTQMPLRADTPHAKAINKNLRLWMRNGIMS